MKAVMISERGGLSLQVRLGERIELYFQGQVVKVHVAEIKGRSARLVIQANREVKIHRDKLSQEKTDAPV